MKQSALYWSSFDPRSSGLTTGIILPTSQTNCRPIIMLPKAVCMKEPCNAKYQGSLVRHLTGHVTAQMAVRHRRYMRIYQGGPELSVVYRVRRSCCSVASLLAKHCSIVKFPVFLCTRRGKQIIFGSQFRNSLQNRTFTPFFSLFT